MKTSLLAIILVFLFTGLVRGADTFKIFLSNNLPIQYCSTSIPIVAPTKLSIETSIVVKGIKVSFSDGFVYGEDELVYSDAVATISGLWYGTQGYLQLQPKGGAIPTISDYLHAIESVVYKNNKQFPTSSTRKVSISLFDSDYLPITQHFYRFVKLPGISWMAARDLAASNGMMYFGLRGYLATITSQEENDFIKTKTTSLGWIGANDETVEGDWRWVTGPEGLEDSGKGLLFWRGTGGQAQSNPLTYGSLKDPSGAPYYENWNKEFNANPPNFEPNNSNNEDYAHITVFPQDYAHSYKWNDLPNTGSQIPTSDFYPAGYLIEFGGMPNDPKDLKLSETIELQVSPVAFKTETIDPICEGVSVTLNQPDNYSNPVATYLWSPDLNIVSKTIANPKVTPSQTTTYTVTAKRGACTFSHDFKVNVNPKPKVTFDIDSLKCNGYNLEVNYTGGLNPSGLNFTWILNTDTIKRGNNIPTVTIPLGTDQAVRKVTLNVMDQFGCTSQLTSSDILVKPNLSPWTVTETEVCLTDSFEFTVTKPDLSVVYDWDFGDGKFGKGAHTFHLYNHFGGYHVELKVTNPLNKCTNSARSKDSIYAAPLPVAAFTMSDSIVYKDKPNVDFTNTSSTPVGVIKGWEWNFGDYGYSPEFSPSHSYKVTGRHKVLLAVSNEFGCKDSVRHTVLVAFGQVFTPNAFSPNSPNPDDRIFLPYTEGVRSQGYHLTILSRWDDVIYDIRHQIKGWDGKLDNGSFAPPGVYIWRLLFNDFLDRTHQQSGTVTLIY